MPLFCYLIFILDILNVVTLCSCTFIFFSITFVLFLLFQFVYTLTWDFLFSYLFSVITLLSLNSTLKELKNLSVCRCYLLRVIYGSPSSFLFRCSFCIILKSRGFYFIDFLSVSFLVSRIFLLLDEIVV